MSQAQSEEEEWKEISFNVLVLAGEHYSFWLLKSFVSGWEIHPLLREQTHELCDKVLQLGPPIEDIPNDADYLRLHLYAAAELVFHFTCLVDKIRPQTGENSLMKENDLSSLLRFCHLLLHYYSLRQNLEGVTAVKQLATDLFALNLRNNPDNENFFSIVRDVWTKCDGSQFGDFSKIKAKRPSQETVRNRILQVAEDAISNKTKHGSSSLLYEIFTKTRKEAKELMQEEPMETHAQEMPVSPVPPTSVVAVEQPVVDRINVSLPLPLSAVDIGALPTLSNETLSQIYDAFVRAGYQKESVTFDSIRDFFSNNSQHCLIVPMRRLPPEQSTSPVTGSPKLAITLEKPSTTLQPQVPPAGMLNTSMSPSFSECFIAEKSPKRQPLAARATSTTPTTEVNPTIRALVRGVVSRKNAEKAASESAMMENATAPTSVPPESVTAPSQPATAHVISKQSMEATTVPPTVAVVSAQQSGSDRETPSVAVKPRLKERIGAPVESSTESESSFTTSSSEEDYDEDKRPRKKRRPWTTEEYKAVMAGVKRFGEGRWRDIQLHYPVLSHRTNVAVKDAYRLVLKNPSLVASK